MFLSGLLPTLFCSGIQSFVLLRFWWTTHVQTQTLTQLTHGHNRHTEMDCTSTALTHHQQHVRCVFHFSVTSGFVVWLKQSQGFVTRSLLIDQLSSWHMVREVGSWFVRNKYMFSPKHCIIINFTVCKMNILIRNWVYFLILKITLSAALFWKCVSIAQGLWIVQVM